MKKQAGGIQYFPPAFFFKPFFFFAYTSAAFQALWFPFTASVLLVLAT
jgi:hypothetical protein